MKALQDHRTGRWHTKCADGGAFRCRSVLLATTRYIQPRVLCNSAASTASTANTKPQQNSPSQSPEVYKTIGSLEDPILTESLDADVTDVDDTTAQQVAAILSEQEENPYTPEDAAAGRPEVPEGLGEQALEQLLAEGGKDLSVERVCQVFPYPLDGFQRKAVEKFLEGKSVVVCAPTGAGKTAIAEAAAAAVLARGQRVIYTTPLKALSNQKLFEMRKRFGHVRCGLQTGDTSLNTEAQVVIMTTEILRNIMYRIAEQKTGTTEEEANGFEQYDDHTVYDMEEGEEEESDEGGLMTREARLADVGLIVMDEVHYLADPSRGSVWEEAIINCPRHIQLLCMSATVRNPEDLGAWISKEHMECETVKTMFRPVPLHWLHAYTAPPPRGVQLVDLLNRAKKGLNPRLEPKAVAMEEARGMMSRQARFGNQYDMDIDPMSFMEDPSSFQKQKAKRVPAMEPLIIRLRKQNLLPAIWFILSRKDCDLSAVRAGTGSVLLTSETEQAQIRQELAALQEDQPDAVRENLVPALIRGVASHHAGHLPGWKSLVERLFQRGLLKIVFATGTLAAGINMPARTTIISALGRKTDDGPQLLPHNELLQMAGRAGRRGYDTEGNCVVLQTRWEGPVEAWAIIKNGPEPLVSHFTVSYGLVLNLLSVYSLEQAKAFCNRSFGTYLRAEGVARRKEELAALEAKIEEIQQKFAATASVAAKEINLAVKTARDELKAARFEAEISRMQHADEILQKEGLPRKVVLSLLVDKKNSKPGTKPGMRSINLPAVLIAKAPKEDSSDDSNQYSEYDYLGLGSDNRLMRVNALHVVGWLEGEEGTLAPEAAGQVEAALGKAVGWAKLASRVETVQVAPGNNQTAMVALQLQPKAVWHTLKADQAIAAKLEACKQALSKALAQQEAHRRQQDGEEEDSGSDEGRDTRKRRITRDSDKASMAQMARARNLQAKADKLREEIDTAGQTALKSLTEVVDILGTMGAIQPDTLQLQPLGLVARNIQGQNELWLALVLTHPAMLNLTGPELAGVLGAILCGEVVRKTGQFAAAYTASQKVVDAVNAMEGQRQLLSELQAAAGLGAWNDSLLLDLRLAGIVEAWAAGATWKQVVADSGMDDGDIARLLIRTVDLLKQLSWQKELLPHLTDSCLEALQGMDRKPIAETVM